MYSSSAWITIAAAVFALSTTNVVAENNGLAITPQMGWNTWNKYACNINEDIIRSAAQGLVDNGLKAVGYHYVIIDDCWSLLERDNVTQQIVPDPVKFPSGMKTLADDIHKLGLGFGIYSDAGTKTCGGHPGSLGYEVIDANTFASWGVDYLKYDNCYNQDEAGIPQLSYDRYRLMSDALNATGRPILYGMCNWGQDDSWNWAGAIANSWRISCDIYDNFKTPSGSYSCPVSEIVEIAAPIAEKGGRGGWNDMDMLEIGNGGMTTEEYRTMFTMWAVIKSPLILGNDVKNITAENLAILTNTEIIAVNQDRLYKPATRVINNNDTQLWTGVVQGGKVVVMYNKGDQDALMTAKWSDVWKGWSPKVSSNRKVHVRDLWAKKYIGHFTKSITEKVPAHGVRAFKFELA